MGREIERKYLVVGNDWRQSAAARRMRQGYLSNNPASSVRVRMSGEQAWLTIKGLAAGAVRPEFEYEIPLSDASEMLESLCTPPLIEKTRYRVEHDGMAWVVDEFEGENAGLVLAEIELESVSQPFSLPSWAGDEVTDDLRYYNACLQQTPYSRWEKD